MKFKGHEVILKSTDELQDYEKWLLDVKEFTKLQEDMTKCRY